MTNRDLEFYENFLKYSLGKKYLIPSPTLCVGWGDKRRRLSFEMRKVLSPRRCDKQGIRWYLFTRQDKPFIFTIKKIWWGDDWSHQTNMVLVLTFNKAFFDRFQSLQLHVPRPISLRKNCENAEFTNLWIISKTATSCRYSKLRTYYYSKWIIDCKIVWIVYKIRNECYYECQLLCKYI